MLVSCPPERVMASVDGRAIALSPRFTATEAYRKLVTISFSDCGLEGPRVKPKRSVQSS